MPCFHWFFFFPGELMCCGWTNLSWKLMCMGSLGRRQEKGVGGWAGTNQQQCFKQRKQCEPRDTPRRWKPISDRSSPMQKVFGYPSVTSTSVTSIQYTSSTQKLSLLFDSEIPKCFQPSEPSYSWNQVVRQIRFLWKAEAALRFSPNIFHCCFQRVWMLLCSKSLKVEKMSVMKTVSNNHCLQTKTSLVLALSDFDSFPVSVQKLSP